MRGIDQSTGALSRTAFVLGLLVSLSADARAQQEGPTPSENSPPSAVPTESSDSAAPYGSADAPSASESTTAPAPVAAAAPTAPVSNVFALRPAPVDLAAFPPRPPARVDERGPGVELHGFVALWSTPTTGDAPSAQTEAFRLRFAVLRIDARPFRNVSVQTRLSLTAPTSPLLDATVSYVPHAAIGVTAGQFRLPIGAAATTLAPQLVMLDRPSYVYAMTKVTFRDVGVMLHSGPRGVADGLLHYRAVVASGGGRAGVGTMRAPDSADEALYALRVVFDPGRLLFEPATSRLALGATYVRSHDPAIATGDAARDRSLAGNTLGRTLAPIASERVTQLVGGDLTFVHRGVHAQAELLYMHSESVDGSVRREALGASVELAYTLPWHPRESVDLPLATRAERFDPRLGQADDQQHLLQLGLNTIAGPVRGSVFGTLALYDDAATGEPRSALELSFRAASSF